MFSPRIAALTMALVGAAGLAASPLAASTQAQAAPVQAQPAHAQPAHAQGAGDYTFVKECLTDRVRRAPLTFDTSCADGAAELRKLHWRNWGSATATATGVMNVNLCEPNCAQGRTRSYPVKVVVSRIKHGEAAQFYRSMKVTYTKAVPPGFHRTETVPLAR